MVVRVWRSFACNNSSSYRIVARFSDDQTARDVATELQAFLAEATPLAQRRHRQRPAPLTTAASFPVTERIDELASEHGFDWTRMLSVYDDDDLEIVAEGTSVIVYDSYCLGIDSSFLSYLEARGGAPEARTGEPTISVMFRLPNADSPLSSQLSTFFSQAIDTADTRSWPVRAPWSTAHPLFAPSLRFAFFCDGKTVGFHLPIDPSEILPLKEYLSQARVTNPRIRVCEHGDLEKFRTIAKARCSHCASALEYLDMYEHGIGSDQLACPQCGGMFELTTFA
jgi:hypothetical protein